MKKLFFFVALVCALTACHSDLDLGNVDTKADVNLGLALPVGSLSMTLSDMLGDVDGLYIDSTINNMGVLTWKFDTTKAESYHDINLADFISKRTDTMSVYKQIAANYPFLIGVPIPMPKDCTIVLEFPLDLPLTGINENKTNEERLDSAWIEDASFFSIIKPIDFPISWDCVDSIVLDLGDRFRRKEKQVAIYGKDPSGPSTYGYGDSIHIMVDKFTLDMMKTKLSPSDKPMKYWNNVYDTCSFTIRFKITLKKGTTVTINSGSALQYTLGAKFLNFSAIWGMFEPSNKMNKEELIDMSTLWKSFDFLTESRMPFTDPEVKTQIITHVAGALKLDSAYMYTLNANNDTAWAKFDEEESKWFYKVFNPGQYLDPITSAVGDSAKNMYVTFDKTPAGGRIHNLFQDAPQKLGYKFGVGFYEDRTPQIRITPNTTIRVKSTVTLPFIFGKDTYIRYPQTTAVNLSKLSIDSLQASTEVIDTIKASNVKLVMKATTTIPLNLKYTMRCLDENGDTIKDPLDRSKDFLLFTQDTIQLKAPAVSVVKEGSITRFVSTPQESVFMVDLSKEQLNVFPKVSQIVFTAVLDNDALKDAYDQGFAGVALHSYDYVLMKIGLAANVEGVFNFGKNDK